MRYTTRLTLVLPALALAAGCAKDQAEPPESKPPPAPAPTRMPSKPTSVTGVDWVLARLGETTLRPADIQGRPRFWLDPSPDRRVSGHTGVNSITGTYELSGGALQFGPLATTRRAGSPDLMLQESGFLNALKNTATAELTDRGLVLRDVGGAALAEFEATYVAR